MTETRRKVLKFIGIGTVVSGLGIGSAAADDHHEETDEHEDDTEHRAEDEGEHGDGTETETILEFESMVGNSLTGDDGAIRDVNAGGLPWIVDEAEGKLDTDGRLRVKVEGLVLAEHSPVPENLQGTNPIGEFRAVVSCLTIDGSGHVIQNRETVDVPATSTGDAKIEDTLTLPDPCLAPVVFVGANLGGNTVWFATTGA